MEASAVNTLNLLVADLSLLGEFTLSCHWFVTGYHFREHHKMFGEQYEKIKTMKDEIAERIRLLGGKPPSTFSEYLELSSIQEETAKDLTADDMLAKLQELHTEMISKFYGVSGSIESQNALDSVTDDLLIDCIKYHEQTAFCLEQILED